MIRRNIKESHESRHYQKQISVDVIDANMGTGKSSWATMLIRGNQADRFIVVLPMISELYRYNDKLKGIEGLVSLHKGDHKKIRFDEALQNSRIILITHALFEDYLNEVSFEELEQGKWNLIMDEVVTAFEQAKINHTSIRGLVDRKAVTIKQINDKIEQLIPDKTKYQLHMESSEYMMDNSQKSFLKEALSKDAFSILFNINNQEGERCYSVALKKKRLLPFESVRILTYLFKDTDLDYWFQINKIKVNHLQLTRNAKTNSISDFSTTPHNGKYSGSKFKHLIEFLDPPSDPRKQRYGEKMYHFSSSSMKDEFNPRTKNKGYLQIQKEVRNVLTNLFRNKRKTMIEPNDFMFTCRKESKESFQDSKNRLTKDFIGESTFIPFNHRATNKLDHKHFLAYIYNAFPFPSVVKTVHAHGLKYNQDRYSLYILIQWIWRSAIRNEEKIYIYIPSKRMRGILELWLNA